MLSQIPPSAQVDVGSCPALVLWVCPAVSPQPRLAIHPPKGRCRWPLAPQRTLRARPDPAPPASVYLLVLLAADLPSRTAPTPPQLPPPVLSPLTSAVPPWRHVPRLLGPRGRSPPATSAQQTCHRGVRFFSPSTHLPAGSLTAPRQTTGLWIPSPEPS